MGLDIALVLGHGDFTADLIGGLEAVKQRKAKTLYLLLVPPQEEASGRPAFALWADGPVDLAMVCAELSRTVSPLCTIWKSETAGIGGYLVYEGGYERSSASSVTGYSRLLVEGIEKTFGRKVKGLNRENPLEAIVAHAAACYRIDNNGRFFLVERAPQGGSGLIPTVPEVKAILPFEEGV